MTHRARWRCRSSQWPLMKSGDYFWKIVLLLEDLYLLPKSESTTIENLVLREIYCEKLYTLDKLHIAKNRYYEFRHGSRLIKICKGFRYSSTWTRVKDEKWNVKKPQMSARLMILFNNLALYHHDMTVISSWYDSYCYCFCLFGFL